MIIVCLYRLYDRDGALLYIGISINVPLRVQQHRSTKSWGREIANVHAIEYPDRAAAQLAEATAIRAENPPHNRDRPWADLEAVGIFAEHSTALARDRYATAERQRWLCAECDERMTDQRECARKRWPPCEPECRRGHTSWLRYDDGLRVVAHRRCADAIRNAQQATACRDTL